MTGPWLPLYGSGAVLVLFVTLPVRDNPALMYLVGAVSATILEYFTGVIMERLFRVRYWDYSSQKFNFQGQICLSSSIAWGFLTLFLVEIVQRPVERLVLMINEQWLSGISYALTVVIVFDFASAFRTAIDLRDVIIQAERAKKELQMMQKRIEILEAVLGDSMENMTSGIGELLEDKVAEGRLKVNELTEERMSELMTHLENVRTRLSTSEGMEKVRVAMENSRLEGRLEDLQSETIQMKLRLEGMAMRVRGKMHPRNIRMLYRNPSAIAPRYKEEWQYLKDKMKRSRNHTQ
jgi:uncharacterized membrane protein